MSDENIVNSDDTPINENHDDLDAFEAEFFGAPNYDKDKDVAKEEEVVVNDDDTLEEEVTPEEDDTLAPEDEEEAEEEPKPEPPKKKDRFQERIDQMSEKVRLERERADALEARLAKLEQGKEPEAPKPEEKAAETDGPQPDNYPLGEFDPDYVRDLIRFTHKQEREAEKAERAKEQAQEAANKAREELDGQWQAKLEPAQERYPDFHERGEELLETFADLEPAYGEFLSAAIMGMEHGPDVLYHLASNIDEAKRIAGLGPVGATIALGRLESKFDKAEQEEPKRPKTSSAPPPPPRNKGSAASAPEVADDTDDLAAFEAKFFKGYRK